MVVVTKEAYSLTLEFDGAGFNKRSRVIDFTEDNLSHSLQQSKHDL